MKAEHRRTVVIRRVSGDVLPDARRTCEGGRSDDRCRRDATRAKSVDSLFLLRRVSCTRNEYAIAERKRKEFNSVAGNKLDTFSTTWKE